MYRSSSSRVQEWSSAGGASGGLGGGSSRLPRFVQARSAQHRLKILTSTPKPTAIVPPVVKPLLPQIVDHARSFKHLEWADASKLYNIAENDDIPENIEWNQKTVDIVIDDNIKTRISQLEYQLNQMDTQLRKQDGSLRSTRDELARALNLSDSLDREKKLLEESVKKSKEAHFETELRLCSTTKLQSKYEGLYEQTQAQLEAESTLRSEHERQSRRFEAELKISSETLVFAESVVKEVTSKLSVKQEEIVSLVTTLEEHQRLIAKLQQEIKILQDRIIILEKEVTNERISKEAFQRSEAELQNELQALSIQFQEILNKNLTQEGILGEKEREVRKSKQELADLVKEHESTLTVLKSKFTDQILNLNDQLSNLQRQKLTLDKSIIEVKRKNDELGTELESAHRIQRKLEISRTRIDEKAFERQLRIEQQQGVMANIAGQKAKLSAENDKLRSSVIKAESSVKEALLKVQMSDHRILTLESDLDQNSKLNHELKQQVNILTTENTTLGNKLNEKSLEAENYARKLTKSNENNQLLINQRHEFELLKIEELENQRIKNDAKLNAMNDEKIELENKIVSLENVRTHLLTDIKDLQDSLQTANNKLFLADQKIQYFEKTVIEINKKLQETVETLHITEEENHSLVRFVERLQSNLVEAEESLQKLGSENGQLRSDLRNLDAELLKISEQAKEADRQLRKLSEENIYNLKQLERAETCILDRDEKIARLQIEIANFTLILEQKIEEKRVEFEIIRKTLNQKILELTINLESEVSLKEESLKRQKYLELQVVQTEELLHQARRHTEEAQSLAKKFQEHNRILTQNLLQSGERCREIEKKLAFADLRIKELGKLNDEMSRTIRNLNAENVDLHVKLEQVSRNLLESQSEVDFLASEKRRVETDFLDLQSEFTSLNERFVEQGSALSRCEAENHLLQGDVASERSALSNAKAANLRLETQLMDMQHALERAERQTALAVEKALGTIQVELLQTQSDLIKEKEARLEDSKHEQTVRKLYEEMTFQFEEERKRCHKMEALIETLENKVAIYNRQREDAEIVATTEYMRCKTLDTELLYTNERADLAESVLNRVRTESKIRATGGIDVSFNRSLASQ